MLQKLEIGEERKCRDGVLMQECRDAEVQLLCTGADAPQQTSLVQHYV